MTPSQRVRKFRERLRKTYREFADLVGISPSHVCNIEAGRKRITTATAVKLSAVMKCKPHTLLDWIPTLSAQATPPTVAPPGD